MRLLPLVLLFLSFTNVRSQFSGISEIRDRILSVFMNRDRDRNFLEKAVEEAVREAEKHSYHKSGSSPDLFPSNEPLVTYGRMMAAQEGAADIAKKSMVLLKATEILVDRFGLDILDEIERMDVDRLFNFPSPTRNCDPTVKYRSYDGSCNNLDNPEHGSAFHTFKRLLPPKYEDGVSSPRSSSVMGSPLPSPRLISNQLHQFRPARSQKFNLLLMQFGQLVDHEITHAPVAMSEFGGNLNCSSCDSKSIVSESCWPIPIPEDDARFSGCLPFVRSLSGQQTFGPREQMNQITSFIDGSVFYGSSKKTADSLRTLKGGKLRSTAGGSHLGLLLPQSPDQNECKSSPQFPCFSAGDSRSSQQPMLQSLHVIFHRHHNLIAEGLSQRRMDWDDETLFQETRRIVAAQLSHIVYSEFLPKIIGESRMSKYNLHSSGMGFTQDYDSSCDSSISQSFATAAFRFGHSLVSRLCPLLNGHRHNVSAPMDLVDSFNNMQQIYNEEFGSIDSLLMGMAASSSMAFDSQVSTVLRNHLFAERGNAKSGMDLAAINIQRGRDHGIASYNEHREFCGSQKVISFSALLADMHFELVSALERTYDHVDDIDLFTGLLAERPDHDALVGPTTICLLAEQFSRLKRCDRYFYNHRGPGEFTAGQLAEIRKSTLAGIICSNSRLSQLQPNVFELPDDFVNSMTQCDSFPRLDLDHWA